MSAAPIAHGDGLRRYHFWLTEGVVTREFTRDVPEEVLMGLELHPMDRIAFLRRALADPRFAGCGMAMEPA